MRSLAKLLFLTVAVLAAALGAVDCAYAQVPAPLAAPRPPAGPQAPQRVATVPPQPQVPAPPQVPPPLSPQEQAALDQLLAAWEARSAAVRTWSCTFYKWEYDDVWGPVGPDGKKLASKECTGTLKYGAPDKGLFRVETTKQWNAEKREFEVLGSDAGDHWICNGESIYQFDHPNRVLKETRLPPEMRGAAISDGPLPFVFGAKAETLKKRYWMRIITPQGSRDQIWLEALPRFQADAQNFSKVELMLQTRDLMPFAIRMYLPGGKQRDVYQFAPQNNFINQALDMIRDFAKPMTPLGYKYVLDDVQAQAGPSAAPAAP